MKRICFAIVALIAVVCLAACSDPHAGEHCVHSHEEIYYTHSCLSYSHYYSYNSYTHSETYMTGGCTFWQSIPYTDTVCDSWAPNDPATVSDDSK